MFADLFNKRLTTDERRELAEIVEQIARSDGPSAIQAADIADLKRLVGVAPAV